MRGARGVNLRFRRVLASIPVPRYGPSTLVHRSTLRTAETILDRFFRDAEGRTNVQIDVGFSIGEVGLDRDRAAPAIDYLVSRGLLNTFGPDVAFLTELGVRAAIDDADLAQLPPARSHGEAPAPMPAMPPPSSSAEPRVEEAEPEPLGVPNLTYVTLEGEGRTLVLQARCTVGRASTNDIPIDDQRASKHHAVIRYERGAYVLEDLESANGTLLNGAYCVEPTRLSSEDEIVIGRTLIVYSAPESFPAPVGKSPTPIPDTHPGPRSGSSLPTQRPGPIAPELGAPGIKVVRGLPDEAEDAHAGALFDPAPTSSSEPDLFGGDDDATAADPPGVLPRMDTPPLRTIPSTDPSRERPVEPLPATRREPPAARHPDIEDLRPTLLGEPLPKLGNVSEAPVLDLSDIAEELTPAPSRDPAEVEATTRWARHAQAVRVPMSSESASEPPGAGPAPDEMTTRGSESFEIPADLDPVRLEGEALPVANASLADLELPTELAPPPAFMAALDRLRTYLDETGARSTEPVIEAVDFLREHPAVMQFAERDDPS